MRVKQTITLYDHETPTALTTVREIFLEMPARRAGGTDDDFTLTIPAAAVEAFETMWQAARREHHDKRLTWEAENPEKPCNPPDTESPPAAPSPS